MKATQREKADNLLALHHDSDLLVLPNIWDVLGAKMLEKEGFKAIATASASVAFSKGFEDNESIGFDSLLELFQSITSCTNLPVTVDIEKGYASSPKQLEENIKQLIGVGVVGLNIEDSKINSERLEPIEVFCDKIKVIRKVASKAGIPLVINARTDIFLHSDFTETSMNEAIARGKQYKEAGADCFYPILYPRESLAEVNNQVSLPINVLAQENTLPIDALEKLGIARLSFGPALLRFAYSKMKEAVSSLKNDQVYLHLYGEDQLTSKDILEMVRE